MKALIDGDMILYRSCFSAEKEIRWDDDIFTVHSDFSELKKSFVSLIDYIQEELNASEIIVSFSDRLTFRHQMYPLYKAQRQGKRSPLGINDLREWVCESYDIAFWKLNESGLLGCEDLLVEQVPRSIRGRHDDALCVRPFVHRTRDRRPHVTVVEPVRHFVEVSPLVRPPSPTRRAA